MSQIMTQGQALSTWSFSGSAEVTSTLFADVTDPDALRPIRIQGFVWTSALSLTVSDAANTRLFEGPNTLGLWPAGASGSAGITVNAPLTMTVGSGAVLGGRLTIYGEVL